MSAESIIISPISNLFLDEIPTGTNLDVVKRYEYLFFTKIQAMQDLYHHIPRIVTKAYWLSQYCTEEMNNIENMIIGIGNNDR